MLLKLFQEVYEKKDVEIIPDDAIVLDRTIKNTRTDFHYPVPSYQEMLLELRDWMNN
jgi:dTDP-4-dehydrorhamnose reductase